MPPNGGASQRSAKVALPRAEPLVPAAATCKVSGRSSRVSGGTVSVTGTLADSPGWSRRVSPGTLSCARGSVLAACRPTSCGSVERFVTVAVASTT